MIVCCFSFCTFGQWPCDLAFHQLYNSIIAVLSYTIVYLSCSIVQSMDSVFTLQNIFTFVFLPDIHSAVIARQDHLHEIQKVQFAIFIAVITVHQLFDLMITEPKCQMFLEVFLCQIYCILYTIYIVCGHGPPDQTDF